LALLFRAYFSNNTLLPIKRLKEMLHAVDRIMKEPTTDAEGVQKELQNQGYGDISLADVEGLMKQVQVGPTKTEQKPVETIQKPPAIVVRTEQPTPAIAVPTEMTSKIEQQKDGVTIKTDKPARQTPPPRARIDELIMQECRKRRF
jgi:hypothetical protein